MTLRDIPDNEIRIGIGKITSSCNRENPWYVTLYSRDLRHDQAQAWFRTHAEAITWATKQTRKTRKKGKRK